VEEAMKIAPVYFVTGNHDNWLSDTDTFALFQGLENFGVIILSDEQVLLCAEKEGEYISLVGMDDDTVSDKSKLREKLGALTKNETAVFTLVLAHQPQRMSVYSEYEIDLVLSGHAHGGQFRIPFVGGFVAPDQGFLPEYTKGLYEENGTKMIVSAGLGNSVIPQRLLNRPEVVKITFNSK
jgi:predicted MPP superfamily phosphohydrolase